ncbi:unnamed protein product [Rhizoctonia solani]|uniref:Uncharacterized protein n=1 Tax=Rhizoctonia solani TaxID=456999 RepID=A0A8H3HUB2_9AGAM|nr:unnamed protein product [Rhizoctonia solani]
MWYPWFIILLTLDVCGALPLPRRLSEPDLVAKLLDARQFVSVTSSPIGAPTQPITSAISLEPNPLATSSIVAPLPTNPVATISTISVPTTFDVPTATSQPTPTTTSSVPLLYTQTSTSSRSSSSVADTPTPSPVTDINVPFSQSKYHQMIIALGCFAVGLLIAFIVTVIVALRAKSDVDLLRDRLNRCEEEMYMNKRKDESPYEVGYAASRTFGQRSYGQVSMSDPDDTLGSRPRRSVSEGQGQFRTLPYTKTGQGGAAKGRRVTFNDERNQSDASLLLSTTTSRDAAPQYPQSQPLAIAPPPKPTDQYGSPALVKSPPQLTSSPPPQFTFTSAPFVPSVSHPPSLQPRMSDPGRVGTPPIRRLPVTPGTSSSSHEGSGYADPSTNNHDRSGNGGYPSY